MLENFKTCFAPSISQKLGFDLNHLNDFPIDGIWPVTEEKHNLIRLDHAIERYKKSNRKKQNNSDPLEFEFIGVVRDPIVRLISAYRDKIGRGSYKISRQYYWQLYGKDIIRRYRHKKPPTRETTAITQNLIPTFPEFIQYVIDEYPGKK